MANPFLRAASAVGQSVRRIVRRYKKAFVFAVCGDRHAQRVEVAIRFLKQFSKKDIVIVQTRVGIQIDHDQVITVDVDPRYDNHQASIFLKTSLHRTLGNSYRQFCYLDNDIIAVDPGVDTIFDLALPPIAFAHDFVSLEVFSPYAVECDCNYAACNHLHQAIEKTFGVRITKPGWQHWNGGVFVFNHESAEFMETWHRWTMQIFGQAPWRTRDQGTLAAAIWKFGLQDHPTLPRSFNYIVDPYYGFPLPDRIALQPEDFHVDDTFSLNGTNGKSKPFFLHLINGGIGRKGWKHWDDAEQLLTTKALR
jgi:hypothetical protein